MLKLEDKMLRDVYVELMRSAMEDDKNVMLVEADLMRAAGTLGLKDNFASQIVDVGVAEANMIGVSAGLSAMGKTPFAHTFTPFATRRVFDQITLSIAYAGLNLNLIGSDPGITAEYNGGTHMSMEDVGLVRTIPNAVIIEPSDSSQLHKAFPQILEHYGLLYMRLMRKFPYKIFNESSPFEIGKGIMLKEGKDVTIVASGIMTAQALMATELLKNEGIDAEIINIHTIKPLDAEIILKSAAKTGCVITTENHSIIGGLGSAVSEVLSENLPTRLKRIGVRDHFGEVGLTDFLLDKYSMTPKHIAAAAIDIIAAK